jgi:group II intron reverse transcriptase/maturase
MTPGVTEETADRMSLEKIDAIIAELRQERYHWKPARRTYIPKKSGKLRPLGMPVWSDKLLAEVLRRILEAYYDPTFSEHSHGFRPGRGCHTALRDIYEHWAGTVWYIEGDVEQCFDRLDHELLLSTLSERIHDGRLIALIRKLLDAGYLEDWIYHQTLSGVPQGSILSPLLSNILLDKLDKYVETVLIPQYTRGHKRRWHEEYTRLMHRAAYLFKKGETQAAERLRRQAQQLPSQDPQDPHYRRLRYVRYADDWLIGFVGPKAEAEEIKQQIAAFLRETLHLELSKEKTLITHAKRGAARFLGYEVTILQQNRKRTNTTRGTKCRSINGRVGLRLPWEVLHKQCERHLRNGKTIHRAELLGESDYTIVARYQKEYRGIANYYRLAYNMHTLSHLKWMMEQALTKTLAHKHRMSVPKVYKQYQTTLTVDGSTYKGLLVTLPRAGKTPLIATWGGIPLKWDPRAFVEDQALNVRYHETELVQRLLAQRCEQCGATRLTDHIEVHHIRALKDLEPYTGRHKPTWVKIMAARQRKTLVLCRTCHLDIQYGRPVRRQLIKLKKRSSQQQE